MKIIIVGTAYPYRGGIANFNEKIAKECQDAGHDVEIYTFTLQYPSFLFPGKTQYSEESAPQHLKIFRKVNSINPFNWLKVGREIKKKAPDLVIAKFWMPFMGPCLGTLGRIIRRNKKTKVISILDNIIPHEKRVGDKVLTRYFVKSIHGFIAMSKSVLADLSIFDTEKPRLFSPHPLYDNFGEEIPVVEAKNRLGFSADERVVLFFGIIRAYKGLDLLLKAFADKRIGDAKIKLVVAGEFYEDSQSYIDLIKALNIEDRVSMHTHFIPDSEVNLYFSAADIVAQPYKSATQSGVTQIAYHFEKPMLVTDVGGLAEIVPHQKVGYVVQPDEKEIANALIDFFENNRGEEFLPNIVAEKEKYSWRKMLESMDDLMKQIKQ
ncbi:glycosyltransferase [Bacteroidales bacterium OttesenSCG-928-B11]|nr:glycosyltransferase [Bacteroidales bacterium OttesenSCG-928-B11]